ncbi:MAG: hypothetical protein Q3M24_17340 [Candidatus Electrothrix aestuarii]|uniref:Glucosyl transferase GtrII n=1 Tax=Candidatus Electrothrix aestuarii TaxID=3062594 RepID=A0AAU8LT98_9BACT|nr:hypothetical protein [Candidatus Electrothrix aestuarii]
MTILNYKSIHSTKRQFFLNCSIIILLCFILLRWFLLIDRYSVNMLFWDQWDFLGALFDSKGPWELFSWQHGPHRQGIGFFLTKIVADCSGWNTRVESFMIGIVVCLAALTAAFLKLRLVGKITALDIFIALLYLTPLQFGLVANTPNVSHGAMPLLLITLFCLCWTIDGITLRYVLCAIINFMEIYTGFGIFLGCITPILFLSELYLARKRKQTGNMFLAILFFFIALASVLSFFIDYTFCPAAKGFTFPYPQPLMYAEYIIIALGAFCGIRGSHIASMSVGFPAACCMIYIIIKAAASIVRDASNRAMKGNIVQRQIILVLVTFTLTFSLNLAIGRVCLGLETATASRYTPYITPAFFALYLFSTTRKDVPKRLIIFSIVCFFVTTFSIGNHNRAYAERLCQGKLRWKQAYLQTENIRLANRISGFAVHPNPSRTHLKRKLDYLKEHRLNLYLPSRE